jgi:diguanylate cyclase (GGDEF)-like protein
MSYYDELTGFGNRHLLEEHFEKKNPTESIGVLYCDVTGLKQVNDTIGHKAGDDLLKRACECLTSVFPEYSRFRMGGDEFLIICDGIEQEEMNRRIEQLKKIQSEKNVVLAMGCVWKPDGRENMDKLFAEADNAMYRDKREYYKKNDRRRHDARRVCLP